MSPALQSQRQLSSPTPPTPTGSSFSRSLGKKASYGALNNNGSQQLGTSPIRGCDGLLAYSTSAPRAIVGPRKPASDADSDTQNGLASTSFRSPPRRPMQLGRSVSPTAGFSSSYNAAVAAGATLYPLSEQQVARVIAEHLVNREEIEAASSNGRGEPASGANTPRSFGSVAHSLVGGSVTHDIYQWQEKRSGAEHRRRNSEPDLMAAPHRQTPDLIRASHLMEPGVFRRHFVTNRAVAEGRQPINVTRNFIDFLALYGFYGGDVIPEEDEDDDDVYGDEFPGVPVGAGAGDPGESPPNENTALIGSSQSGRHRSNSASVHSVQGTSGKKVFFMLMKAFVGTGVLFLPKAFANGGMGFSIVLMVLIGWLTLHCMLLLVETSRKLGGSFGDLGEKLYGNGVRQLVLASIAISQAGFCCAYYIFVAQNLRDLTMIVSNCQWILPDWFFIVVQLVLYIPLSWVRRIKHFHVTSLVADVFILLGLGYIFYYDLTILATRGPAHDIVWINAESFSLFVGTAMFAFEGICLILPIAESMKRPEDFGWILTLVIAVVGVIFIGIGATGYLTFGAKVETVVFLNMPKSSGVVLSLQFFYAIAILLSFPLCVYPSIRITESAVFGVLDGKKSNLVKWQKNLMRAVLVAFLGFVAWSGSNNLDKVVSLVGCLACIPLSFIYPALFHYHIAKNAWVKFMDIAIVLFGAVAVVYTTYVTLEQWVDGAPDVPVDRCADPASGGLLKAAFEL
ncbi:transmembrane amino acid transporter protein-domain-containing protein [Zopfochytrium polystomum]|nr:transmembrane amino acid transporter protein-domain-containing protein [Zopfochytrium polystomum]